MHDLFASFVIIDSHCHMFNRWGLGNDVTPSSRSGILDGTGTTLLSISPSLLVDARDSVFLFPFVTSSCLESDEFKAFISRWRPRDVNW